MDRNRSAGEAAAIERRKPSVSSPELIMELIGHVTAKRERTKKEHAHEEEQKPANMREKREKIKAAKKVEKARLPWIPAFLRVTHSLRDPACVAFVEIQYIPSHTHGVARLARQEASQRRCH